MGEHPHDAPATAPAAHQPGDPHTRCRAAPHSHSPADLRIHHRADRRTTAERHPAPPATRPPTPHPGAASGAAPRTPPQAHGTAPQPPSSPLRTPSVTPQPSRSPAARPNITPATPVPDATEPPVKSSSRVDSHVRDTVLRAPLRSLVKRNPGPVRKGTGCPPRTWAGTWKGTRRERRAPTDARRVGNAPRRARAPVRPATRGRTEATADAPRRGPVRTAEGSGRRRKAGDDRGRKGWRRGRSETKATQGDTERAASAAGPEPKDLSRGTRATYRTDGSEPEDPSTET